MASITTWRVLGLSVAAGYAALGTIGILKPRWAAEQLLGFRKQITPNIVNDDPLVPAMQLMGTRDLSIGVALFVFDYCGKHESMGQLILSGMILCAADVYKVWRDLGPGYGVVFGAGAAVWGVVGYGLAVGKGGW